MTSRRLVIRLTLNSHDNMGDEDDEPGGCTWRPFARALSHARADLISSRLDVQILTINSEEPGVQSLPSVLQSEHGLGPSDALVRLIRAI